MHNAQMEIDESLKELTKSSILELRALSKPHALVEKVLTIICALRGFKNLSWATARDLLGRPSFKVELKQMTPNTLRAEDVFKAQQILV